MQEFLDVSKIPAKGAITGILGATTIVAGIAAFNPQLAGIIFFGMLIVGLATAKFIWIRSCPLRPACPKRCGCSIPTPTISRSW